MARVLHVFKGDHAVEAAAVIAPQAAAGDEVAVALLAGVPAPASPAGVTIHRVPEDTSYERLLELIFEADTVVTW
jgi:predicted transcriptional regulator